MATRGRTLTVYLAADSKRAKQEVQGFTRFLQSDFVKGLAVGAVAMQAFQFAVDAVGSAMQDLKEQAALGNIAGNLGLTATTAEINDWVDSTQAATGVLDTDLRGALQRLLPVTGSFAQSQSLIATAMDAAAGSGKPLATVIEAVTKAAGGNFTALGKLFPELKNVAGATSDLATAQEALNSSYGGSAATAANSYAGQLQRLKIAADEAQETIGTALLGAITDVTNAFGGPGQASNGITAFAGEVSNLITGIGMLATEIAKLTAAMGDNTDEGTDWGNVIRDNVGRYLGLLNPALEDAYTATFLLADVGAARTAAAKAQADAEAVLAARLNGVAQQALEAARATEALRVARANAAVADRYTAQAVDIYNKKPSFTGGNLSTYFNPAPVKTYTSAVGSASKATDQLTAAQKRQQKALEDATKTTNRHLSKLDEAIGKLKAAQQAWQDYYDTISGNIGGNDLSGWYDEWKQQQKDIAAADKAITDAIASGAQDQIDAANQARRELGTTSTLSEFIQRKQKELADWNELLRQQVPGLAGVPGGQEVLTQLSALGPATGIDFVQQFGAAALPELARWTNEQAQSTSQTATLFANTFYQTGITAASATVQGLIDKVTTDRERLRRLGKQMGEPIAEGIKQSIIDGVNSAYATLGANPGGGDPIQRARFIEQTMKTAQRRLGV